MLAIVMQISDLSVLLAGIGLPTAAAKFVAEQRTSRGQDFALTISSMFALALFSSLSVSAFLFLSSRQIALLLYRTPTLIMLIQVLSLSIPFSVGAFLLFGAVQGFQKMSVYSKFNTMLTVLNAAVIVSLTWILGLFGSVLGVAIATVISFFVALSVVRGILKEQGVVVRFSFTVDLSRVTIVLRYAMPLLVAAGMVTATGWYARTFLAVSHGYVDVGLFKVVDSAAQLVTFIPNSLFIPLLPLIAEMHATDIQRMRFACSKVLKLVSITVVLTTFYIGLSAPFSIPLLLGPQYLSVDVVRALSVLLAVQSLNAVLVVPVTVLMGSGRTWLYLITLVAYVVPFLLSVPIFIDSFGLFGLASASLLAYAVYAVALFHACRPYFANDSFKWVMLSAAPLAMYAIAYVPWGAPMLAMTVLTLPVSTLLVARSLVRDNYLFDMAQGLITRRHTLIARLTLLVLNKLQQIT